VDPENGKPARTRFRRLAVGRHAARSAGAPDVPAAEPLSLVEAVPGSGRTNQIRVHAAHLGYPVLGDKIYGIPEAVALEFVREGETERVLAAAGAPRHLLHCDRLEIAHPAGGAPLDLRAPPPRDFELFSGGPIPNGR
jgi:23S rRNA-/tRNA-specific pseudouridylate synthase